MKNKTRDAYDKKDTSEGSGMTYLFKKGFTLVELLVVISIIAILVAMGAVSYSNAQSKARDARRITNMKDIQGAMEQAYTTGGVYPVIWTGSGTGCTGANISTYLSPFPSDPKSTNPAYACAQSASATDYCVCADLEGTAGGNSNVTATGTTCPGIAAGSGGFYCVKNKQ